MDVHKLAFLKSHGIDACPDIIDCDPLKMTVSFANGDVRQVVDCYTRVMGYHAAVSSFNIGKRAEHSQRRYFREAPLEALALTED